MTANVRRLVLGLLLFAAPAWAQGPAPRPPAPAAASGEQGRATQQAQLQVIVVDQTGAGIPSALVRISPAGGGPAIELTANEHGVSPAATAAVGLVQLHVESGGFESYDAAVLLRRGANTQTVTLPIAGVAEEVVVSDAVEDDRSGNALSTTLDESTIDGLSDDPDELADQLEQLTGGAGASFVVDGFRGGRLPAKQDIRQIRFRMNSFSADNHDAGRVMVEVITRPGLNGWSGNLNAGFRGDLLNARNAFARAQTPEQFRRFTMGLRGPLVKGRTSLRINVDGNRSFDTGTIVAQTPDLLVTGLVRRPVEQTNVTVGVEHGLSKNQTLRLEYRRTDGENRNLGVGDFSLAERAFTRTRTEDQVRASLQSVLGPSSLNVFRLQVNRTGSTVGAASSAPAVIVLDAFSTGGAGVSNETANRTFELADDLDFSLGRKHAIRAGFLLNGGVYRQSDARNAYGTFTFGSLQAYVAGLPTTYTQRLGQVRTAFDQYQIGVYVQDDIRIDRTLSVSVGLRQEAQTHLGDSVNLMPRLGFTANPFGWKTTLRGGYGLYHDFFGSDLYDQTQRVNGIDQRDLLILNPGYPDPFTGVLATVLAGGRVQAAPDLRMPRTQQASIGAERALSPVVTVQASYAWQRGRDQLRARNVNAPDENGVRPQAALGTVTQIESTGRSSLDRLTMGLNVRLPARQLFMSTNYTLSSAKNDGDNPLALPADSLHPDLEWGPSGQDVRHRFTALVNLPLPFAIRANLNGNLSSAAPYTITTGRDDNRDGVTNDRPAGVGRNTARGAARFDLNLRLTRGVSFGAPLAAGGARAQRGTGGGGGQGRNGAGRSTARFSMEFYAQAFNLLNRTNYTNFSGNLLSPFFGLPTSAAQARRLEVGLQFRF